MGIRRDMAFYNTENRHTRLAGLFRGSVSGLLYSIVALGDNGKEISVHTPVLSRIRDTLNPDVPPNLSASGGHRVCPPCPAVIPRHIPSTHFPPPLSSHKLVCPCPPSVPRVLSDPPRLIEKNPCGDAEALPQDQSRFPENSFGKLFLVIL